VDTKISLKVWSNCLTPPPLSIFQRDLDFNVDIDFKGQLCEVSKTSEYRMR